MAQLIDVEVACALPEHQEILKISVPEGATIQDAIDISGVANLFPSVDVQNASVGIFSKLQNRDAPLKKGDRVEIYRPLIADPKIARKVRSKKNTSESKPKDSASSSDLKSSDNQAVSD